MCMDPTTGLSAALNLASRAAGAAGSLVSGAGTARQARYQQTIARANADNALLRGNFEAARIHDRTEAVLDGQTASVAARGIDPAFGSPLVMQGFSAAQGAADESLVRASALQERATQEWAVLGAVARERDARRAGVLGAATALLTSASRFASRLPSGGGDAFSIGAS